VYDELNAVISNYGYLRNIPPVFNLAGTLADRGVDTLLLGFADPHGDPADSASPRVRVRRMRGLKTQGDTRAAVLLRAACWPAWLSLVARSHRHDLLVSTSPFDMHPVVHSPARLKVYYLLESEHHGQAAPTLRVRLKRQIERSLIRRFDVVAVPNASRAMRLQEIYGRDLNVKVVRNVPRRRAPLLATSLVTRRDGDSALRMVYAGALRDVNCVSEMIEAARIAKREIGSAVSLDLYGNLYDAADRNRALIDAAARDGVVSYCGEVPYADVPRTLAAYDVGVVLYRPDDFNHVHAAPCKLYEYAAAGLAVIANRVDAYAGEEDLWQAVNYVTEPDPRLVADVMLELARNRDSLEAQRERVRRQSAALVYEQEIAWLCDALGCGTQA
jgi:glycosyltransferase involved in cell wall biosynthesis